MCGLCAAAVLAGGVGLRRSGDQPASDIPALSDPLREPEVLRSSDGLLQVRLEVTTGITPLAGGTADLLRYNGQVPGPTLRLQPGDHLVVDLTDSSDQPTNLHTHGLAVSPTGNGDNPFVVVDPGACFRYEYVVPDDQPAGTYWYHPHHHGLAADQVFRGLYGAIIIEDPATDRTSDVAVGRVPGRQRVLVISDVTLDPDGHVSPVTALQRRMGREGELVLVNGQRQPRLTASPGDREQWHLVNACVSRFLRLRLDGQRMDLLGIDLPLGSPRQVDEILLMPGNRADVVVTLSTGVAVLQTVPVPRIAPGMSFGGGTGSGGIGAGGTGGSGTGESAITRGGTAVPDIDGHDPGHSMDLADLVVTGSAVTVIPRAPITGPVPDLRGEPLTAHRTITLAMGMEMQGPVGMSFTIDGHRFDPARVDQRVPAGALEQWTIVNTSEMDHPFHLHVWPMQIVRVGDVAVDEPTWQNVVNVPARSSTIVLIRFGPASGRTVYHCHILDHEDAGMMGVIEVS